MDISAKKTLNGQRDYLRVARTLRDKLDRLITSGAMDLGTQRQILLDVSQESTLVLANNKATLRYDEISNCTHSCCDHEQVMNPDLWSTLPKELLQRVFAKLPIPNICRLKSLSKEWHLSLRSSCSEFTQALKESSPKILAGVTPGAHSSFWLNILDGRNNRWHALHVYIAGSFAKRRLLEFLSVEFWVHMNGAADAGLVCYVEKDGETNLNIIFVINPMTGVIIQLPILKVLMYSELTMMRIVVDRDTYHYKVIVVVKHGPSVEAEVYNSEVRQWTKPMPSLGRIFGIAYDWSQDYNSVWSAHEIGPCAYDCREGKYYDFGQDQEKWSVNEVISFSLMKDRLFVLHWDQREDAAFISEYCISKDATSWVKQETHNCFPQVFWESDEARSTRRIFWEPDEVRSTCRICACSGFLFVFQDAGRLVADDPDTRHENGWVYDLATCEWRALPRFPWWSTRQSQSFLTNVMCELHWNIRP